MQVLQLVDWNVVNLTTVHSVETLVGVFRFGSRQAFLRNRLKKGFLGNIQ